MAAWTSHKSFQHSLTHVQTRSVGKWTHQTNGTWELMNKYFFPLSPVWVVIKCISKNSKKCSLWLNTSHLSGGQLNNTLFCWLFHFPRFISLSLTPTSWNHMPNRFTYMYVFVSDSVLWETQDKNTMCGSTWWKIRNQWKRILKCFSL